MQSDHAGHEQHDHAAHSGPGHGKHHRGNKHQGHHASQDHGDHHAHMVADFKRRFWVSTIVTIPILALSPMIQEFLGLGDSLRFVGDLYVLFLLATVVFVYGGRPFIMGLIDEIRSRNPGMMTLIGVAITTAYIYSGAVIFGLGGKVFFWELATLIDIMLLGHWVEMRSVMGASRALKELAQLLPSHAHKVMPGGDIRDFPLSEIRKGDRVLVKPGERVPVDGGVVKGESSIDESMITGESSPVYKRAGEKVIGGSLNGEGAITVEVHKTGEESFLSQMIGLVREAQESKSRSQDLANRAALWLTVIALGCGAVTLAVWWFMVGRDFAFSLERTVTVMVITCPHALGLAIPLVVAVSTVLSARNGLIIRNRTAFERARNIQAIIFDKTGTITTGSFGVTDVIPFDPGKMDEGQVLRYAAAVEANSEHPIARGIVSSTEEVLHVDDFRAIPGKGAEGTVEGKRVRVVSSGYLREQGIEGSDKRVDEISSQGKTVVFIMVEDALVGAVGLADTIRPESREAIARLKSMGIQCMMLTGDRGEVARWVSEQIGLDEYFAEVLPQEKASKVREVQAKGLVVAMTGDGVNDAPALAQADVGIAIGAGTDIAVETADIILVNSNPLDAVAIIGLARATYGKMLQNLAWATGYNVLAIPLAAGVLYPVGVLLSPAVGAVLMSLSTVIVAVNATFLKVKR
ncbi:MAG: copper-translocating P-type ATPase [bacterium]